MYFRYVDRSGDISLKLLEFQGIGVTTGPHTHQLSVILLRLSLLSILK